MKSLQFRSIAPKAPAVVPSPCPAVLSCQTPPVLPEATAVATSKSIIVPTQNYALMQITGQDGTFSLVALPPSVSSQSAQQQQPVQSLQKNLKLPIPRYQPMRKTGSADKVKSPTLAAKVTVALKVAEKAPGASPTVTRKKTGSKHTKAAKGLKEESTEKVLPIDPVASDISVMSQLPENPVLYPGCHLERPPDVSEQAATSALLPSLQFPSTGIKGSSGQYPEEGKTAVRPCQSKAAPAHPQNSFTVLSPAIFSKAIQIIPSPLNGKLPILPYSKMKSALLPAAKTAGSSQENKGLSLQAGHKGPAKHPPLFLETAECADHAPVPKATPALQVRATLVPVQGSLQKPPSKKRGRKRKTMEDILAFEARKKRSLSFFRRRIPEKPVVSSSKQKEVDISKKYRSIRPKPLLLMETVPQLVSLSAASDAQEQELVFGHQLPATVTSKLLDGPPPVQEGLHLRGSCHPRVFLGSRPAHRCPTCSRCFQFKHHLQSHMNSHTNSRPHVCPVCRKAYAHSGSLSTHTKLHHSDVRPRRSFCCEFCQKAFGYVGVYFSHLREVHKVFLTVEPSVSHHEHESAEGASKAEPAEEQDGEDPAELQIRCGRCQTITPTFTDMKMHLLYVHEEEVQVRLSDSQQLRGGRKAENDLVRHAAHYWRQLREKRNPVKCGSCDEGFASSSKLKRHIRADHPGREGEDNATASSADDSRGGLGVLAAALAFNCVLCSKVLDTKQKVLEHWRSHHHCEQPDLLWDALSSYAGQRGVDGDSDSPDRGPHYPT